MKKRQYGKLRGKPLPRHRAEQTGTKISLFTMDQRNCGFQSQQSRRAGQIMLKCQNILVNESSHTSHPPQKGGEACSMVSLRALHLVCRLPKTCRRKRPTLHRPPLLRPCLSHPVTLILVLPTDRLLLTNMHDSPSVASSCFHIH